MTLNGKQVWLSMFGELKHRGKLCSPRGEKVIELEDYHIDLHPIKDKLCSFKERKLSLSYNFTEFAWYLSGNRNDTRMEELAPFWLTVKNDEQPHYNSNYGFYLFIENQVDYVIDCLLKDKDSRQACVVINRPVVMMGNTKDKLCTNTIMFRIRDNKLNMSVQMRSNDIVTGLGIDAHMFSLIYEIVYQSLLEKYWGLQVGNYHHTASSFHIYERNFQMMEEIVANGGDNYIVHEIPTLSGQHEIDFLKNQFPFIEKYIRTTKQVPHIHIPEKYKLTIFAVHELCKRWKVNL